jgi:stage V sporulation protein S
MVSEEDYLLRVGGKTPVSELAGAISHGVYDGKKVVLRVIGNGAIGQAMKAVAIARGFVAPRGIDLLVCPGFTEIELPDGKVTGMVLRIIADD